MIFIFHVVWKSKFSSSRNHRRLIMISLLFSPLLDRPLSTTNGRAGLQIRGLAYRVAKYPNECVDSYFPTSI